MKIKTKLIVDEILVGEEAITRSLKNYASKQERYYGLMLSHAMHSLHTFTKRSANFVRVIDQLTRNRSTTFSYQ